MLTVLAAVVVVLTRVRLSKGSGEAAGRVSIPKKLLNTHTGVGVLALLAWSAFLFTDKVLLGWLGLLLWWVTAAAGLLILARWMPARGRHSSGPMTDIPREWAELDGEVESGPGPASEPETRAIMRFLSRVDPRFVVSFHQPLYGIDTYGSKMRWFAHRLARALELPEKDFACGSACHGTLTQWFNYGFDGVAVTVEYGARPTWRHMDVRAPRQLISAVGGSR